MSFAPKRFDRLSHDYLLGNHTLAPIHSVRDLGVGITEDLLWSSHVAKIAASAFKMLGLLRRSIGSSASTCTRKILYISLVRSRLVYGSPVWRPHLIKDIKLLESVQKRATKWILCDFASSYKTRLKSLNMLQLMMILELSDLSVFLKAIQTPSGFFDILDHVSFSSSSSRSTRLVHNYAKSKQSHHFYFNRLPRLCPSPPEDHSSSQALTFFRHNFYVHLHTPGNFSSSNPCTFHKLCPCCKCS